MAIKILCIQENPIKSKVMCYSLLYCLSRSACVKETEAKQRGQVMSVGKSEFEALLLAYIAVQITNLGAAIPASRCYFNPTFEANHPVMILLIANEGSDGR